MSASPVCFCTYTLRNVHVYILTTGHTETKKQKTNQIKKVQQRTKTRRQPPKHTETAQNTKPNRKHKNKKTEKKEFISKANKTDRKLAEIPGARSALPPRSYILYIAPWPNDSSNKSNNFVR